MLKIVLAALFALSLTAPVMAAEKHPDKNPKKKTPVVKVAMPKKGKKKAPVLPTILFERKAIPIQIHTIRVDDTIICSVPKTGVMMCTARIQPRSK